MSYSLADQAKADSPTVSLQLIKAAELCKRWEFKQAESIYRQLLNMVQLSKGFGHRDVKPILLGLSVALDGTGQKSEAAQARILARDIDQGMIPVQTHVSAFLRSDESLVIFKRIVSKNAIGGTYAVLKSGDMAYSGILEMIGGLTPGQAKLVSPLSAGADVDEASAMVETDKQVMKIYRQFNMRYRNKRGVETMRIENTEIAKNTLYAQGLMLCLLTKVWTNPDFVIAYQKDAELLSVKQRIALAHFLQPGLGGIQETYAWLFVASNEAEPSEELKDLPKSFPNTLAFLQRELPALPAPQIISVPQANMITYRP